MIGWAQRWSGGLKDGRVGSKMVGWAQRWSGGLKDDRVGSKMIGGLKDDRWAQR